MFFKTAIPKLTGIVWSEDNLQAIVDKLTTITDKQWAQKVAWDAPEKEPEQPAPTPEAEETTRPGETEPAREGTGSPELEVTNYTSNGEEESREEGGNKAQSAATSA